MARPCWMAAALAVFLSAQIGLAAVDQNWLTSIIEGIKNEYALGDSFSLAMNVPQNQDPNNLQQVFQDDPADKVIQTVSQGQVYQGTRVVAAAQSGALSSVLENIAPFMKSSQGNFLIIYSEESPCGATCSMNANENGIADKINNVIQNWNGYAFVFSKVVDVPDADTSQLAESFKQLQISKLGLDNIFRCYEPGENPFQCTSCFSDGDVTPSCVANKAPSNEEQGTGEEISTPTGTDTGEQIASVGAMLENWQGRGGEIRRQCKRKGGCSRRERERGGKGGKARRQCKRRGGCSRRGVERGGKGGKARRQCKRRGGCSRRGGGRGGKGGKARRQCKRRGGCSRRGGGRGGKGRKQRRGGKGRKWSKAGGGRRRKGKRGGKGRGRRKKSRGLQ